MPLMRAKFINTHNNYYVIVSDGTNTRAPASVYIPSYRIPSYRECLLTYPQSHTYVHLCIM